LRAGTTRPYRIMHDFFVQVKPLQFVGAVINRPQHCLKTLFARRVRPAF